MLKNLKRLRIGLDIQSDVIRLLALEWSLPYRVRQFAEVTLQDCQIQEGKCHAYHKLIAKLQQLAIDTQTKGRAVQIALPFKNVMIKKLTLPASLSRQECEIEIKTRLAHYLPSVTEAVQCDIVQLRKESVEQHLLLAATKNEILHFYANLVVQAGFKVKAIDVDSYALTRAIFLGKFSSAVYAVLVVYANHAEVIVLHDKQIIFQEWIVFLTAESKAEKILKIHQCLRVYHATNHSVPITKIILLGGDDSDYVTDFPIETFSSTHIIQATLKEKLPHYAKALGLALWGCSV